MMAYKGREHIDTENIFQVSLGMIAGILLSIFILKYTQFISGIYMMPGFIIAPIFSKYFNPKYSKTVILFMATLGSLVLILRSFL